MTEKATKAALLKQAVLQTAEVELPGLGTVTVRALTRAQVIAISQGYMDGDGGAAYLERQLLRYGLVDPELTAEEIETFYDSAPSDVIEPITETISRLSGMKEGIDRQAMQKFRNGRKR